MKPAWAKPEHAIAQRQQRENNERNFVGYTRELQAIHRNTQWHETYEKYAIGKRNARNDKAIAQELGQANQELKMLRNKRLQELYTHEWEQYEAELNSQGLAILKDRA